MKTLAYTLYVVVVLLISGLARANAAAIDLVPPRLSTVQIGQVLINASGSELLITGSLPNPCFKSPSAFLTAESENVFIVHLVSPTPTNICISQVKPFSTNVVLSALASATRMPIDPHAVYILKVDGSEFQMQLPGSALILN